MKIATTKQRILQFIDYKCISKQKFFSETGLKRGFLDADKLETSIPDTFIAIIIAIYPEINIEWLITGNGPMIKGFNNIDKTYQLSEPKNKGIVAEQEVPLYDIEAAANLKTIFADKSQNIIDKIRIPQLPKCDGAVYVRGDSMYPLLKSGDIVVFKEINDPQCLIYGEMYLVDFSISGDDYIVVKYIQKSHISGHIQLVSYNEHHQPMDIHASSIRNLALVKATIRLNTII